MKTPTRTDNYEQIKEHLLRTVLGLIGIMVLAIFSYHFLFSETKGYPYSIDTINNIMLGLICVLCLFCAIIHLVQQLTLRKARRKEAARKDHAEFNEIMDSMPSSLQRIDSDRWPMWPMAHNYILCKCYDHWRSHLHIMQAAMETLAQKDDYGKHYQEFKESASIALEHLKSYREELAWSLEAVKEYRKNEQEFERSANHLRDSYKILKADEKNTLSPN